MTIESVLVRNSIENQIVLVRGQKVLLDSDLAALYDVEVRTLNQAVKRNEKRFPPDFVFQLTAEEDEALRSQTVISKSSRGGRQPPASIPSGELNAGSSNARCQSPSKSTRRIAFLRTMDSISSVEQLPVWSKITFGGAPRVKLRLAKSLSLVRKANPCL